MDASSLRILQLNRTANIALSRLPLNVEVSTKFKSSCAAAYTVMVQGWGTDGPDANFTLFYWLLDSTAAGNMTVPGLDTAITGTTGTIDLTFSGLASLTKYLGSVAYSGADGMPNPTIVRVDTP